jgi:ABC-type sugar transport system ATPase subunit
MAVALDSVTKRFGPIVAVHNVSLDLPPGEVHAIVGENGAGKSTLVNILSGALEPDSGTVLVNGIPARFKSPSSAIGAGVATIYQERALVPHLTIAENIVLGQEPTRLRVIDGPRSRRTAKDFLAQVHLDVDPRLPTRSLASAEQQLVAIAKALSLDAKLLILDEPTAALTADEAENLYSLIVGLRDQGLAILYITHRLKEVERLADTVTVLKDGQLVTTVPAAGVTEETIIPLMVGREVDRLFPPLPTRKDDVVLEAQNVDVPGRLHGVSLTVRAGEIVGIAGLEGSGKSTLAGVLAGAVQVSSGVVTAHGRALRGHGVREALGLGVGYIPPDRRSQGIIRTFSVRASITLASLPRLSKLGMLLLRRERREAEAARTRLEIRTPSVQAPVDSLSGGNQQKVVLARALAAGSEVLVCDEPTAGVDVGSRAEIYGILADLANRGSGIVVVSSDVLELLGLCHRVVVLTEGRVVAEFEHGRVTEEELVRAQLPRHEEVMQFA